MNLLLIDDDKDFLTDLNMVIEGKHNTAEGSREALRLFKKQPADVCLVDIRLPTYLNDNENLEGLFLAKELVRLSSGKVHIIFMSRHAFPETENLPFPYHFLPKPFHINELLTILGQLEQDSKGRTGFSNR